MSLCNSQWVVQLLTHRDSLLRLNRNMENEFHTIKSRVWNLADLEYEIWRCSRFDRWPHHPVVVRVDQRLVQIKHQDLEISWVIFFWRISLFLTFFRTMLSLCLEMGERGEMSYLMALYCWICEQRRNNSTVNTVEYIAARSNNQWRMRNGTTDSPSCTVSWRDRPRSSRPLQLTTDRPETIAELKLWQLTW